MKIPKDFIFLSYDGDSVGRRVGRAIMDNDLDELTNISDKIKLGHELVRRWVKDHDGIWINGGGDEGLAAIPNDYRNAIEHLRKDYEYLVGHTISVGLGKEPSQSGRALLIAKLQGKDRTVEFSDKTEKEIKAIKKRARKGAFKSMEEYKLAGAYLKKEEGDGSIPNLDRKPEATSDDCEYCKQSDGVDPDHCKYCHDEDSQEGEEACKYCSYDHPVATTRMDTPELAEQDCAYCKEKDQAGQDDCEYCNKESDAIAPNAMNPSADSHNDSAPAGSDDEKDQYDKMGMNPPIIGKPNPAEEPPVGQNPPMDTEPNVSDAKVESAPNTPMIDPEDNHSKDALVAIAQQIEKEGNPPASKVDAIDDPSLPSGRNAEGNVSRPEGYEQNVPQDMGLGGTNPPSDTEEDEPDFGQIFEEGLNSNASSIQKEKVIRMVSQALTQFKGCKQMLENIKLQAPQLYQASISMLRAMIEMANLLELGGGAAAPAESTLGQEQEALLPAPEEQPHDEWKDPFPAHPDQGGEPKPGHAPSSAKEDDSPSPQP